MALFGPGLFEFIPSCPRALFFRWAVFVCGSVPQINTPLVLFSLPPSSRVPCPQQHFAPHPLSACWLLGTPPEGRTVPKWCAEMAGWSPQTAAQLLSPPALSSENRDTNTDKTDERWSEGTASWQWCHSLFGLNWLTSLSLLCFPPSPVKVKSARTESGAAVSDSVQLLCWWSLFTTTLTTYTGIFIYLKWSTYTLISY